MRTFFVSLLKDLKRLTGVKQYEEIASNPKGKEEAQIELDALLEPLVEVCNLYPYIPDTEKMKIIKARVIDSPEFYGLNARFVRLALERVKDIYWKESGYIETNALLNAKESNAVPLEECSKETQRMVKEFASKLAAGSIQGIAPANAHELKVIQLEDQQRIKPMANSVGYPIATKEELEARENHRLYILANYDKITGKKLTEWVEESEWIKLREIGG
jgi:hypothetical protein